MEQRGYSSGVHGGSALAPKSPPSFVHPYYAEGGPSYGEGIDGNSESGVLLRYWRILARRKAIWLSFAVGGALLGIAITIPQTPVYRARTSLEVLSLNEDFMNMKQSSPVTNSDSSYETSELQTQMKVLQSDMLLDRVLEKLDPTDPSAPREISRPISGWRKILHLPAPVQATPRERLLDRAADSLSVRATGRTRILEATVDSPDPKLAADFANTLANQYIEENLEARWKTTRKTSDWLGREIEDERRKLETSEDALQAYARSSGLVFTDDDTNISTGKLQQLQQELSTATADRIAKQSRYELARNGAPDTLPDILNDVGLRQSETKITDLRRQIADLSAVYTPEFSKIKRLQAELATLESSFDQDRADILGRIKNDYQEASRKEALLAAAYDEQTKQVTGEGEKSIQYNILKREVDSNRQLYDTMLQQLKQSSIASAMRASNVRVLDVAKVPTKPYSPNLKIDSGVGLLFGLLLGIATVMFRERADRTLQQPGELNFWTHLPELGTVPNASIDAKRNFYALAYAPNALKQAPKTYQLTGPASAENGWGNREKGPVEMITWDSKPSLTAEAFRSILTSILFIGDSESAAQILVLTSSSASEGKTTVVSNLGIAMAETKRRVLIVDSDLRRPRIHQIFGVPNERGLGDLLREPSLPDDAVLRGLIQETKIPGLHVLPSGSSTHAAANLLYSPNLRQLLTSFRTQYDMVLVDTPPMLQMPDARIVGRLVDAVVLVARAEKTTRDAIMTASQRLAEDRIHVLGTVLNDWDPKRSPSGYGYSKSSYYAPYKPSSRVSSS